MICRSRLLVGIVLSGMLVLLIPQTLTAGWLGFRNDTNVAVVVQETIVVNNQSRVGRPQKLMKGDAVRDTLVTPAGMRKFTIYDEKGTALFTGNFPCPAANENLLYLVKMDKNGKISIETQKSIALAPTHPTNPTNTTPATTTNPQPKTTTPPTTTLPSPKTTNPPSTTTPSKKK